jgi:hypothetical protein
MLCIRQRLETAETRGDDQVLTVMVMTQVDKLLLQIMLNLLEGLDGLLLRCVDLSELDCLSGGHVARSVA